MKTVKNVNGCTINLGAISPESEFATMFGTTDNCREFVNTLNHKLIDIEFLAGRKIYIAICGYRVLNIPKKCTTPREIAEWINSKDF